MFEQVALFFFLYLITYFIHSSLLLMVAYGLQRFAVLNPITHTRLTEFIWRIAYFAGFITAAVHLTLASNVLHSNSSVSPAYGSSFVVPTVMFELENKMDIAERSELNIPSNHQTILVKPPEFSALDFSLPSSISLPSYLSAIAIYVFFSWLIFAFAIVLHLVWQLRNLNRLALDARADDARLLDGSYQFIADYFPNDYRRLKLRISPNWHSPMVIPNGIICLPLWMTEKLTEAQQRAVLAHEIAHVIRKDTVWSIAYVLVLRLFFFQILNRVAYKQLRNVAELACDANAGKTVQARDLAKALYVCAKQMQDRAMSSLILAAHHEGSVLEQRVRCLLEQRAIAEHKANTLSLVKLIVSGVSILGVSLTATFATPALQFSPELLKSTIALVPTQGSNLTGIPASTKLTVPSSEIQSDSATLGDRRGASAMISVNSGDRQIAAALTEKLQDPLGSRNQAQVLVTGREVSQIEKPDPSLEQSWVQAEAAYAQQEYQKAARLYELMLASGKAEAQSRLNQIHARLQKQTEIETYLTDFQANDYRFTAKRCPPPENLTASSIRSQNLKTLKQINDWENCYNQFVEQLQQRFEHSPLVPQELASLMTDAEVARANQVLKQTYQRIGAEAQAQLKPMQASIAKWQSERVRAEELAQEFNQRIRRVNSMMTAVNDDSKAFEGTTYANGRPLSMYRESSRVTDEFGWQHRGQTHAIDESLNKKSQEK